MWRFARRMRIELGVIEGKAPRFLVWGNAAQGFVFRIGGFRFAERDVNILENLSWGNPENAVGGFDEIVALAAGVLPAKCVGEGEAGRELFGLDEEAGAIGCP